MPQFFITKFTASVFAKALEAMLDRLEDIKLNALANARAGDKVIHISLDEL